MLPVWVLLLTPLLLFGCIRPDADRKPPALFRTLPVPTSSDVLLVNGRPLTIDGFMALRSQFPNAPREDVLWIARAAMVLEDDAKASGRTLSIVSAVALASFALGRTSVEPAAQALVEYGSPETFKDPKVFKGHVDKILGLAVVQQNSQVLAELH